MKLPFQSKPKTLTARLESARDDAIELVRSVPDRLESSRKQALAVAGAATGAAAGFAFWRSHRDDRPSVHQDPARPATPWKTAPPPPANGGSAPEPADAATTGPRSK